MSEQRAGATPGSGASPDHAYPFGPSWATYHLPFPGARAVLGARDAGVGFDGEGDGGAGGDAGAGGNPDPKKTDGDPPPATGDKKDDDGELGEAGKRALAEERRLRREADDRAKAAEKERDELKAATQTDQEKAVTEAKREGRSEASKEFEAKIRRSEARSALRAAGMTNEKALELYATAPEFGSLKVTDDGAVEGLEAIVEALKKDVPESFAATKPPAKPPGEPSRGPQNGGGDGGGQKTLGQAIAAKLGAQN